MDANCLDRGSHKPGSKLKRLLKVCGEHLGNGQIDHPACFKNQAPAQTSPFEFELLALADLSVP